MKISVIIPSYKDPLLQKTIDSLLENSELGEELEIIVALDGYWPDPPLRDDDRLNIIHIGKNQGMRNSINSAIRLAQGEYLLRTDEHAIFSPGYDKVLTSDMDKHNPEGNWIVTPLRYFLDTEKWETMDIEPVEYMKLKVVRVGNDEEGFAHKFSGVARKRPNDDGSPIYETMAMQGSCWVMRRDWWEKTIVELQSEGYGTHYGDSHEMVFKTWKAGGKLMVDRNAWHSHKHRTFPRTHGYGGQLARDGWAHSLSVWEDYLEKEIVPKWNP